MRSDLLAAFMGTAIVMAAPAIASPTTFTYQGHLVQDGDPAEGAHEFEIRLLDSLGTQIGITQTASEMVTSGSFSMQLDFGVGAFDGSDRYLEISVRSVAEGGAYITLSPNQLVTSAPVAQFALSGNEGPQGIQGPKGDEGPEGPEGPKGDQGIQGADGEDGEDGSPGVDGGQGVQGETGPPGDSHWIISGSMTYYLDGDVGIGTNSPGSPLEVQTASHSSTALKVESSGASSIGLHSLVTHSGATNTAVRGETYSSNGTGVLGTSSSLSGTTHGVQGVVNSFEGIGVKGQALNGGGTGIGIFGRSLGASGIGVQGYAENPNGVNYGVHGRSDSKSGRGVYGLAAALTGQANGVHGVTNSFDGAGVYGRASNGGGSGIGVHGDSLSVNGAGLFGFASNPAGVNYGVWGKTNSDDGYAGYFEGGQSYFEGSVGFGIENPSDQLHINAPSGIDAFRVQTAGTTRIRVTSGGGISLGGNSNFVTDGNTYVVNNLGIGDATPDEKLDVLGNGVISGILTVGTGTPQTTFNLGVSGTAAKTGGGSWAVFSDQRLKKNITSMTGSLDTISALRPVNFEYTTKDHFSYTPGVQLGFIAQEVQQVIPQWVNTADDGYFYLDQVGYEALIVDAIQELRLEKDAEIQELRDENRLLKARLDRLEMMMGSLVDQ